MPIIGEWAVRLVANANGLVQGCEAGARTVRTFAQQARVATSAIGSGLNSAISSISRIDLGKSTEQLQKVTGAVLGVGAAAMTGGVTAFAGAVASATASLGAFALQGAEGIAIQSKLARQLGVTATEAGGFLVLAGQAGILPDDLSSGIDKFALQVGKIREQLDSGGGGALVHNLERLGIDARQFVAMPVAGQLQALRAGMDHIEDATERNATLMMIMGRRAGEALMPLLRLQDADFSRMGDLGRRSGMAVDDSTARYVALAVKELKTTSRDLGTTIGIVGRTLAIAVTPVALLVGQTIGLITQHAQPLLSMLGMGLVVAFAPVLAIIAAVTGAVRLFMPIVSGVSEAVGFVGNAIKDVFTEVWDVLAATVSAFTDAFGAGISNPLEFFKGVLKVAGQAVSEIIRSLGMALTELVSMVAGGVAKAAAGLAIVLAATNTATGAEWSGNLRNLQSNLGQVQTRAERAQAALRNLGSGVTTGPTQADIAAWQSMMPVGGTLNLVNRLSTMPIDANAAATAFERLQRAIMDVPPTSGPSPERVRQITQAIDQQIARLGVSAERQAWLDAQAAGATEQQLAQIAARNEILAQGQAIAANRQHVTEIEQRAITLGMSAREQDLHRLELTRRATDEMRAQLNLAHDRLEAAQRLAAAENQVRQMIQATRTPLEQFQAGVNDMFNAMSDGAVMNAEDQGRHIGHIFEQLDRAFPRVEREPPSALMEGSIEAARAVAAARRDAMGRSQDPQERMLEIMQAQRESDRRREARDIQLLALAQQGFFDVVN